jgi:predicted deacylase
MISTKTQDTIQLQGGAPGACDNLRFIHYGDAEPARPKIYLQAALHADEIPGLLVLHELEKMLDAADLEGAIKGCIVLAPVANPIGLSQYSLGTFQGRFHAADGINFNRNYADLLPQLQALLPGELGLDGDENRRQIRARCLEILDAQSPLSAIDCMRNALLSRAIDADFVFDLHCDEEAMLHLYTTPSAWPETRDLADYFQCPLVLLADISGGNPFDEACSAIWPRLAEAFPDYPIPMACQATTIELRGQADVDGALARHDAVALYRFMTARGIIEGEAPQPQTIDAAVHPLAGVARIYAPQTGVVTFRVSPGQWVESGEHLAIVYPLVDGVKPSIIESPIAGVQYSRRVGRYVHAGLKLCSISGAEALVAESGSSLLSD